MHSNDLGSSIQEQIKDKIKLWNIFYIPDFYFENTGETRNKYCLILSNNNNYLYILFSFTTSKIDKYTKILDVNDYIIIPAGILCFTTDTMIRIDNQNIQKTTEDDFIRLTTNWQWVLSERYLNELLEKLENSEKVSKIFKDLIL